MNLINSIVCVVMYILVLRVRVVLVWPDRPNFSFGGREVATISGDKKLDLAGQTRVVHIGSL